LDRTSAIDIDIDLKPKILSALRLIVILLELVT